MSTVLQGAGMALSHLGTHPGSDQHSIMLHPLQISMLNAIVHEKGGPEPHRTQVGLDSKRLFHFGFSSP